MKHFGRRGVTVGVFSFASFAFFTRAATADDAWPLLPEQDAAVSIPAQEWPQKPGPRSVRVLVHYPGGALKHVEAQTGLMLTLHNWGGVDCVGTASPAALASRLNVVAICVNYLQSGRQAAIEDTEPYDFGYFQALDALRALYFVFDGLKRAGRPFDSSRIYATGGSGGGNVALMANKLAPRTFACVVDLCGMKKLSHDIAFSLPGGSELNARWSRDPKSPNYLSVDHQELRFLGHPDHMAVMKRLGMTTKIVVVHGADDRTCPFADAVELFENLKTAGLDAESHFMTKADLDGKVFTSSGHALGDRTEIVFRVAGKYLSPDNPLAKIRRGLTDFERRDEAVAYPTPGGRFVVSYRQGYPVGRFDEAPPPIAYDEHQDLTYYRDGEEHRYLIKNTDDWEGRRQHILANMQLVMGRLPGRLSRAPLDVKETEKTEADQVVRRKISYQSDPFDRVPAWLLTPTGDSSRKRPAVLCLHQTVRAGKDEPAGLAGDANMHYALELAQRGYVTLAPDYPSLGEHIYDFTANPEYVSGTMKAIWDNIRAVDLLESLPEVDADRIGVIGHSLGGHNAMFTAAFELRLKVIVSSCGFTRFHKDDVPSWTGTRYMPRIALHYGNTADRLPFDFTEIVASFAPRPFLACAAVGDIDFDVTGVREVMQSAQPIYQLLGKPEDLQAYYPNGPHDFPLDARRNAYQFLDQHLKRD